MIKFSTATEAFVFYYDYILAYGVERGGTTACFNMAFQLDNPMDNKICASFRKWPESYAIAEWEWYMSGDRSVAEIKKKAKIWDNMHNGDDLVWSNYGYWWKHNDQLNKIIDMLKKNPETRRAVISHYDPCKLDYFTKDTPCNLILNFYIHAGKLNLSVFARSVDLWFGFCNDQYTFSLLLKYVANMLHCDIGIIYYTITDFHIYHKHKNKKA